MVRKKNLLGCLALCLLPALAGPAAATDLNGFMPAPGDLDAALSFTQESYDEFWRGTEKVPTPPVLQEVETQSASLWFRYGFTERLAVVADVSYVDVTANGTAGFEDSGLQDLTALALIRLADHRSGGVRHTLTGAVGIRTDVGDYEADAPVSLGDGSTDGLLRLVYQIEAGGFYASQQVGFDLRDGDPPNGIPLYTEVGYTFGRLTASGFYSNYLADDGTDIGQPGFTFPSNEEERERLGAKLFLRLTERLGVSASGFTTLDGRNTGDATGVSLGIVTRF